MANWLSVGVFVRSTVYPAEQGDALMVNKCTVQSREEKVIISPLPASRSTSLSEVGEI